MRARRFGSTSEAELCSRLAKLDVRSCDDKEMDHLEQLVIGELRRAAFGFEIEEICLGSSAVVNPETDDEGALLREAADRGPGPDDKEDAETEPPGDEAERRSRREALRVLRKEPDFPYGGEPFSAALMRVVRETPATWDPRDPPVLFQKLLRKHIVCDAASRLGIEPSAGVPLEISMYSSAGTAFDHDHGCDGFVLFGTPGSRTSIPVTYDLTGEDELGKKYTKADVLVRKRDLMQLGDLRRLAQRIVDEFFEKAARKLSRPE